MEGKYLPAGTVCLLKGGKKRVMIVGFGISPKEDPNKVYDYLGALYPEGIVSMDKNMVFNHEQIEQIVYKGLEDPEQKEFNLKLETYFNNRKSDVNTSTSNNSVTDFNSQNIIKVDPILPNIDN